MKQPGSISHCLKYVIFSALGKSNSWKILKLTITAAWRTCILSTFVWTGMIICFLIHGLGHDTVMWLIVNFIIVFAIIVILFLLLSNYFGKKSFDFVAIRNLQMIFFSVFKLWLFWWLLRQKLNIKWFSNPSMKAILKLR